MTSAGSAPRGRQAARAALCGVALTVTARTSARPPGRGARGALPADSSVGVRTAPEDSVRTGEEAGWAHVAGTPHPITAHMESMSDNGGAM